MRLFIELFVRDLSISRHFYAHILGMKVTRDQPDYVSLASEEAQINLCPIGDLDEGHYLLQSDGPLANKVEICLETTKLQSIYDAVVAAKGTVYEPITDRPWNRTDFRIIDPDGAYIRVTTPVHPDPSTQ